MSILNQIADGLSQSINKARNPSNKVFDVLANNPITNMVNKGINAFTQTPQAQAMGNIMNSQENGASSAAYPSFTQENMKYHWFNPDTPNAYQDVKNPPVISPITDENYGLKFRNPKVKGWLDTIAAGKYAKSNKSRLKIDEIVSGLQIAAKQTGVPLDLLTDLTGLESMMGFYDRPINQYPGQYDDESHARGMNMFLRSTAAGEGLSPDERYGATPSAIAMANKINRGQIGEWDVVDLPSGGGGKVTDWYDEEELIPYSSKSMNRRSMLQKLASQL